MFEDNTFASLITGMILPNFLQGETQRRQGINPQTGLPYGVVPDEIRPQGAMGPLDPGSGGIGGGYGPPAGSDRGYGFPSDLEYYRQQGYDVNAPQPDQPPYRRHSDPRDYQNETRRLPSGFNNYMWGQYSPQQSAAIRGDQMLVNSAGGMAPYPTENQLNPSQAEREGSQQTFGQWKQQYAPNDSGQDYDLEGAYQAGVKPDESGHMPDTFKKPNHPTFSVESKYYQPGMQAGRWENGQFVPMSGDAAQAEHEGFGATSQGQGQANVGPMSGQNWHFDMIPQHAAATTTGIVDQITKMMTSPLGMGGLGALGALMLTPHKLGFGAGLGNAIMGGMKGYERGTTLQTEREQAQSTAQYHQQQAEAERQRIEMEKQKIQQQQLQDERYNKIWNNLSPEEQKQVMLGRKASPNIWSTLEQAYPGDFKKQLDVYNTIHKTETGGSPSELKIFIEKEMAKQPPVPPGTQQFEDDWVDYSQKKISTKPITPQEKITNTDRAERSYRDWEKTHQDATPAEKAAKKREIYGQHKTEAPSPEKSQPTLDDIFGGFGG